MDGNVLARRIVSQFFFATFIDFIAFAVQYVPIGTGTVGSVSSQPGSGPTFE